MAEMRPNLREAIEALGAMPEGYCFCSKDRVGDDSKVHEPECADLRRTLSMPLDEGLVKVVARAIWLAEENRARVAIDLPRLDEVLPNANWSKHAVAARAAIEAYEQARDAVIGSSLV